MKPIFDTFTDYSDEYGGRSHEGLVGYECECGVVYNTEGEEVE